MILRTLLTCLALTSSLPAQGNPDWTTNRKPFRIADNLYYVGSKDLASYLIVTPKGDILINSNLKSSVPQIKENIEALGFHFTDIKILLISHAHIDHDAGSAEIKRLTGAKYEVMAGDVPVVETGGLKDFAYPHQSYDPVKVDRILHDGDTVELGGMVLTARLTAGHTKGCTTWTFKVTDHGKTYDAVILGSPNVNKEPGFNLAHNPRYPQIAADYASGFAKLEKLPCDLFLGAHGQYFHMEDKLAKLTPNGPNPFVDPSGYKAYIAQKKQEFEERKAYDQTH